jgi:uncharacterized glyoxalase superfamily protein PhnB
MSQDPNTTGPHARAQPESLRGRSLQASLTVKDLDKSLAWYRDTVGFTVEREYERNGRRAIALKAGDVRILLNQDDGARGWERAKGEGFSLMITTVQNVDLIANRVKNHGGTLLTEPTDMPWGARAFRLQDPDGFRWSISSVPPASQ